MTGKLGHAWVGAWHGFLYYLGVGVGGIRIGELGPGHWEGHGLVFLA